MMSDRVVWSERIPDCSWVGTVDGKDAYRILAVGEPGPDQYPVGVHRIGAEIGAGCTNVDRAKDVCEMNESWPVPELIQHGLALSVS